MGSKKISAIFSAFFYRIIFVFLGTSILHLFVRIITLVYFKSGQAFDMGSFHLIKIYSIDMVPNLFAYAILLMVVYSFFVKTRRAIEKENDTQIQVEKEKSVIMSSQEITGLMVESISECNNDIKEWLERRRSAGKAPGEIDTANRKISAILEAFTASMFLDPYIDDSASGKNRIDELKGKLRDIQKYGDSEKRGSMQVPEMQSA